MPTKKNMKKMSKHFFIPHKVTKTKHQKQHSTSIFCKKYMPNFRDRAISVKHLGAQSPDGECSVDGLGYAIPL
jgi:hypothetical protein